MCPVAYQLLNEKFTLTEMQKAYEMIMEKKLDKRNFRKKVITTEGLRELNEFSKSSSKRPARLYTFDSIAGLGLIPIGLFMFASIILSFIIFKYSMVNDK